jgi:hypothetical protein
LKTRLVASLLDPAITFSEEVAQGLLVFVNCAFEPLLFYWLVATFYTKTLEQVHFFYLAIDHHSNF